MGIFDLMKKRRLTRLEEDLKMLRNEMNFNPFATYLEDHETADKFSQRIAEYKTWSIGSGELLRRFYLSSSTVETLNYFWKRAPVGTRMLHSGIPGLIASKMPRILFGSGVQTVVDVYTEDGRKVLEGKSKEAKETLDTILKEMNVSDRLTAAATDESWSGHCFFKLSHDASLSQFPIIETADITNAEVIKNRGVTKAIVFKTWYKPKKDDNWRLDEIYGVNDAGDATITYRLYKLENGKEKPMPLNALPETQDLAEIGLDEDGTYTFDGLKGLLAFEKPNKIPSLEFPHGNYGASDYEGAIDSFDALDEAYSKIIEEIRSNRTIRYTPSSMIPRDRDGEQRLSDDFTNNYVKVESDPDQDAKNQITFSIIPDKTEDHKQKYVTALSAALNKAGLSPFAIGITGLESINASAESQQERNKVTLETRKAKLELWKPFLEKMYEQILAYNDWLVRNVKGIKQDGFKPIDATLDQIKVRVEFGDYIMDTEKQRTEIWGSAKSMGVASIHEAVRKIHPDWEDTDIEEEVNLIRYENGMAADDPSLLPELDGKTETNETDDGGGVEENAAGNQTT